MVFLDKGRTVDNVQNVLVSRIPDGRQESENPVILSIIHLQQNPLESTSTFLGLYTSLLKNL
jgi:hypothetical protein